MFITYESEAIAATLKGTQVEYVIPRQTLLIQLPIAVIAEQPEQGPREPVHPVPEVDALAGGLRQERLPAGQPGGRRSSSRTSRSGPGQITLADKTLGG